MSTFQTFEHAGKLRFHFSGESAGKQIRTDTMQAGIMDSLTPVNVPVTDLTGSVPDKLVSEYETFHTRRKREYQLCVKIYDSNYKQLAIYCKRDNAHKIMLAIAVFTNKGIALFLAKDNQLIPYARINGSKLSNENMRDILKIKRPDLQVYAQSVTEVIRSYEWKTSQKAKRVYSGTPVPTDRKPQTFILKGRPMHDIEHATRQKDDRPHDYGMVAKSNMLRMGS